MFFSGLKSMLYCDTITMVFGHHITQTIFQESSVMWCFYFSPHYCARLATLGIILGYSRLFNWARHSQSYRAVTISLDSIRCFQGNPYLIFIYKIPRLKRRYSTGGLSGVFSFYSYCFAHRFKPSKFVVIAQLHLNPVRFKQVMNQTGQGMLLFML